MMTINRELPVAIIGAGPVGLAAASHLALRNIPFLIFENGPEVGHNVSDWKHVKVFSPWRYNIDKAAKEILSKSGWVEPDREVLPTGADLVNQYLRPLAGHPKVKPYLHLNSTVLSITKKGITKVNSHNRDSSPFVIWVRQEETNLSFEASVVIDASGTWQNPNPIGSGGSFAQGEHEHRHKIAYRIPDILGKDKQRYANKSVLVVGGGHSAINSLLSLAELKVDYPNTRLHWALHSESLSKLYGGREQDALEARGALGTRIEQLVNSGQLSLHMPFYIDRVSSEDGTIAVHGLLEGKDHTVSAIDEIIANTGARPDFSMLQEIRLARDPALECVPQLAELIDPNIRSCGTVRPHGELELKQPETNFYVVGVKSYGRAPTFLMATGYEQVRSIAAWLDGDIEGARRVELDLPETGVCGSTNEGDLSCCGSVSSPAESDSEVAGCCGGAPTENTEACCKLDEVKKAEGEEGCGCGTTATVTHAHASACCG